MMGVAYLLNLSITDSSFPFLLSAIHRLLAQLRVRESKYPQELLITKLMNETVQMLTNL